jgi:Zn-dependent M28 family amino/carboxypeptidase
MKSMRIRRRLGLVLLTILAFVVVVGRVVESERLSTPLPRDGSAPHPSRLDVGQMQLDLQILASDRFEGRAPGTAGNDLAVQLVAVRFRELGLSPFGASLEEPFSFVRRSARSLWRRDGPVEQTFTDVKNVVGFVRGRTTPDEYIVVSAHLDHLGVIDGEIYHGADDDASGTAALLAIAGTVSRHPLDHTVVFCAFNAEEMGLRGARAFVAALPFPKKRLLLDINMDMIGRADHGRLIASGLSHYPQLRPIVEAAARTAAIPVHAGYDRSTYVTGLRDDWTGLSDHGAFHEQGIPYIYFGVEDHADLHRPGDTADRIDYAFYSGAAETVLSALIAADGRVLH